MKFKTYSVILRQTNGDEKIVTLSARSRKEFHNIIKTEYPKHEILEITLEKYLTILLNLLYY